MSSDRRIVKDDDLRAPGSTPGVCDWCDGKILGSLARNPHFCSSTCRGRKSKFWGFYRKARRQTARTRAARPCGHLHREGGRAWRCTLPKDHPGPWHRSHPGRRRWPLTEET